MKKKIIGFMLAIVTLASAFPIAVFAGEPIELTTEIAELKMSDLYLDSDHTTPLGDTVVTKDTELFAGLAIAFNEDNQPTSSETEYYYTFPSEINMTAVHNGILYDGTKTAGTYIIENGEVRIRFDESWLKTNSSAIKIQFDFSFKVDEDTIGDGGEKTIVFPGVGEVVFDTVDEVGTVSKRNSMASFKEDGSIEYEVILDIDHDVSNAVIKDFLDVKEADNANASYVLGTFKLDGTVLADEDILFGTHFENENEYPSFTYPATGGIALSAGTHKITYKVKYNEEDLLGWDTVTRVLYNTAKWTLDGLNTDSVKSTVTMTNTPVAKNHSQIVIDPATGKRFVEWTITLNDGNAPIDMGNAQLVDTIVGNHSYSDLLNSMKIIDGDGNDVTSKVSITYSEENKSFKLIFPPDAGRQKYIITYRTELGDGYQSSGYSNRAQIIDAHGNSVSVNDGEEGIGTGGKKVDYSNITSEMLSNGGGEYGQADWIIQINGPRYPDYTKFELNDFLEKPRTRMWYKRSSNSYDPDIAPDIPRVYYTASDGTEKELTAGVDFNVIFRLNNSEEMFYMSFSDTAEVRQAFKGDIYIKYSTQSVGTESPGIYGNLVEFYYYNNAVNYYRANYNVDSEANLYKEVTKVTKCDDGSYQILWNAIINGNNTDGTPTTPNMEINGEHIIISDTLPQGTKLLMNGDHPEKLQFCIKGLGGATVWDWDNAFYSAIVDLAISENSDGSQTFSITIDTSELWKPKDSTKYLVYLSYLTETDSFASGEYGTKTVTNEITANTETRSLGTADATASLTNAAVEKTVEYIQGSGNQLKYTIHVNDGGIELNEGNTFSVWDQFDPSITLVDGTLKVYLGDTDTQLDGWNASGEIVKTADGRNATKYTINNLPDSTHLRVEYNTIVAGEIGEVVSVENTAELVGHLEHSSTVTTEIKIEKSSGQASGASGAIEIIKVDAENINKKLNGAEFKLYSVNLNTGAEKLEATKVSDENGSIVFNQNASGSALMLDTLYYYQETKAPNGYVLDDTKRYFMLKGDNYDRAFQRATAILDEGIIPSSNSTYSAFNVPEKKNLVVDKVWKDYKGNVIMDELLENLPEITLVITKSYIDSNNSSYSEQMVVKLNNENNWHFEQEFNAKSPTGEEYTYEVEELEVEGYTSEVKIDVCESEIKVSAVNTQISIPVELPDTGGSGEMMFVSIGLSLIAIGLFSAFMLKKGNSGSAKIKIFKKKG